MLASYVITGNIFDESKKTVVDRHPFSSLLRELVSEAPKSPVPPPCDLPPQPFIFKTLSFGNSQQAARPRTQLRVAMCKAPVPSPRGRVWPARPAAPLLGFQERTAVAAVSLEPLPSGRRGVLAAGTGVNSFCLSSAASRAQLLVITSELDFPEKHCESHHVRAWLGCVAEETPCILPLRGGTRDDGRAPAAGTSP